MRGKFITLEGPDGSGKTTISKIVFDQLMAEGYKVLLTREPGGIDIAEQIRAIILDKKNIAMEARTEALLYAAARRQHLIEKIEPALNDGYLVICDRFIDSSLVYQELKEYNFWRNLYGTKGIALVVYLLIIVREITLHGTIDIKIFF